MRTLSKMDRQMSVGLKGVAQRENKSRTAVGSRA